ncbi:MAG TPA: GDYXXLXY domain-containing protein [Chthoniobacterales bacterium]
MKRIPLYLVLALQVIGLISLYAYYSSEKSLPGYLLRTRPVDPRDLLRGDYVILSYDISMLPEGSKSEDFPGGQAYVTLRPEGEFWKIGAVSAKSPETNEPVLKAQVKGRALVYDIEKYFVPEGMGNPPLPITVEIVIRTGGRAQIRQLYADGQRWPW